MNIDQTSLSYIQNVVKTADLVKINNIIIEPGKVRAIDENRTVVLFQDKDVPDMPFGSIGLNRIDVFSSRFDMTKTMTDFGIDVVVENVEGKPPFARALVMKGKGIKVDYRCANPATIQAPKALHDTIKYCITMSSEAVLLMQKGQSAMNSDEVTLVGDKDGVSFIMSDINSDALVYKFADVIDVEDGDTTDPSFTHKYPIKTILPLFKTNPVMSFHVTSKGMLKVTVNGLNIYVLPRE